MSATSIQAIINQQIIIMSDNEQGFAAEETTQLIQFNYQPSSRAWATIAKKGYESLRKPNALSFITCSSRLINSSIHSQWIKTLYTVSKPKNIIYSANSKIQEQSLYQQLNLTFQSQFESGNMEIIARKKTNEYELFMKPDSNTQNHFQWFYFKLFIKKGNKSVKFTIKNFIKSTMLYSKGLKPYCKSLKNLDFHQYKQIQSPVRFYEDPETHYYNMQFSYNFQYDDDEIQFCSQPPYTYKQLGQYIQGIKCKKLTLGKTLMGTKIPYLIFQAKKQTKVVAIVIARQHPGETVGSWMMEGMINQLSQQRNDFISWYIVPMVNIDGVILGNNRTGVLGHDFNRNWTIQQTSNSRSNKLFPQIQSIISLIKNLKRKFPRKVKMFLDLHGHSSQSNVFAYGPPHEQQSQYFYQSRLFPQLISKRNNNFKLSQCSYVLPPQKKNTARSIMFKNLGIPFTYTIQSTFGLMNQKNTLVDDFIKIGEDILISAFEFLHTTVIKQSNQGFCSLIQEIKIKYANTKNEGEQYDSGSEASDENPNRMKIQQMLITGQQIEEKQQFTKVNKRYDQNKTQILNRQAKFKSLGKPINVQAKQVKQYSTLKRSQKKRINTEGELILNRKQCIFPSISTRNSKMSFDQISFFTNQEMLQNIKIDQIQKRLHKLRNSKIGKKILVINAYCS